VSPAYFGRNAIWHIPPEQKVDADAITRASFAKDIAKDEFESALIYRLQRRKNFEPNADNTSTSLQLLIIWGYNIKSENRLFVRVLLIKHSNTITWNEDTLERLHSMHLALLRNDHVVRDTWLLDDVTVLITTLKWKKEIDTTEITITEEAREGDYMEPLWVQSRI
jgi:hypothetical protein